ncbi:phosphatases II [Ramaria rubella]|nr:phosphatases II [Ramaria rubella]KAF8579049.1 phosphatases II [Ramaria rubella]
MTPVPCEPLCHFSDRLYFTTFPHPAPSPDVLNRPDANRKAPPVRCRTRERERGLASPEDDAQYYYFTIDDSLVYLSFFEDWGPLNIAMVYKACILIHELLEDKEMKSHRLVLYSTDDPRRKANAALLMALFVMIVQRQAPWEAFHPIAELEFMPFRDAGRGRSDFNLSIQDCLWGVWKAMQNGLCDMNEFSVEDYEYYEKVENGDWNWITPGFIAFASPLDPTWARKNLKEEGAALTNGADTALQRKLPTPFLNCLDYFEKRNVKLVVRLNNPLYDKIVFTDRGIDHLDLYFDDGTNPTDEIVRKFIQVSDLIIEQKGVIAVHCKAGLGRTGTLIGAYLIWKYGFTANEAIAFMRIVRPGCVVGPQQQYMYLKQLEWSKWAAVDEIQRAQAAAAAAAAEAVVAPVTPPREPLELPPISLPPVTPHRHVAKSAAAAKAIATPGQPRKTPVAKRDRVAMDADEDEEGELGGLGIIGTTPVRKSPRTTTNNTRVTTSDRTLRATRSTTNSRKPAGATGAGAGTKTGGAGPPPHKIPRLAANTTAKGAVPPPRRRPPPGSPTGTAPSRLPTLINKRPLAPTPTIPNLRSLAPPAPDAWMNKDPSAVVVPGSKSERPLLRSVRRRRSSFSAADVVA